MNSLPIWIEIDYGERYPGFWKRLWACVCNKPSWHHIGLTWDGDSVRDMNKPNNLKVYVDGKLK